MPLPTNKKEFAERILRGLGYPTLPIEVEIETIYDRIDDALQFYWEYHYEGIEKLYFKHQITAQDRTNRYIQLPDCVTGVTRVLDMGQSSANTLFNVRYQIAMSDLWDLSGTSLIPYWIARRHIEMFNEFFAVQPALRFNRRNGILYLDTDWEMIIEGQWLVAEAYRILDPNESPKVWQDRWLYNYAYNLCKRQMAQNLKKFSMTLPGNTTFNAEPMYQEAQTAIDKLEQEAYEAGMPPTDVIG